jgi:hypothetical protein
MPGTGYYDASQNAYLAKSTETWTSYATWSAFANWAGTPTSTLQFTTRVYDTDKIDWTNYIMRIDATLPVSTTIYYGNTVDSAGGSIQSASSYAVTPNQSTVNALYGRYFQFEFNLSQDSAADDAPAIISINVNFNRTIRSVTQANIDTNTLSGSAGLRNLTFNVNTGKIVNIFTQAHTQSLGDSAQDSEVPIVLVNKSSTPVVLNIFDADSYGKRRRIDCRLDIQAQYLPKLSSDANGNITEIV